MVFYRVCSEIRRGVWLMQNCTSEKYILDVCCGSKMFWFDRDNENTIYMDCRNISETLCDGRRLEIHPDVIGDFRDIPFGDNTFSLVVFDPPH